jgi:Recombinase
VKHRGHLAPKQRRRDELASIVKTGTRLLTGSVKRQLDRQARVYDQHAQWDSRERRTAAATLGIGSPVSVSPQPAGRAAISGSSIGSSGTTIRARAARVERFLSGWGYKEIANHLNRPGGPPPPTHVDSKRNAAGRLFWNRLDFRAVKQGEGPLVRRKPEEWVEADRRHEALVSHEVFERVQAEMGKRSRTGGSRRTRQQKRFSQLRGIVHCSTGHNPLRMHGKTRKDNTYYACCYRIGYGDKAAEALGHGKWQYVREEPLVKVIDAFFTTRVFGPKRLDRFRAQSTELAKELRSDDGETRKRLVRQVGEIEQRIERQLAAIEADAACEVLDGIPGIERLQRCPRPEVLGR